MINLRIGRQTGDFDCGAIALQIVLEYYGIHIREDKLMQELRTTKKDGTYPAAIIEFAKRQQFHVIAKCGMTLDNVRTFLAKGHPVIVVLQAWAERPMSISDWKQDLNDGHYAVIIDISLDNIITFEDPASCLRTWLADDEFLARWHDVDFSTGEYLDRLGIVLTGKNPCGYTAEHMG